MSDDGAKLGYAVVRVEKPTAVMKYSVIYGNRKIKCFEKRDEAIGFALRVSGRAYEWGELIRGQLRLAWKSAMLVIALVVLTGCDPEMAQS